MRSYYMKAQRATQCSASDLNGEKSKTWGYMYMYTYMIHIHT